MDRKEVSEILYKLGFFYVEEDVRAGEVAFLVGHVSGFLQEVAALNVSTGELAGKYSDLVEKLSKALRQYQVEGEDVSFRSPEVRKDWLEALARSAGLTAKQFYSVAKK